ncbi:MAG: hypothetical protein ACR5K9_07000 [Wolbachia sp.]
MDDKTGDTWMTGIKEALGLQCNLVIPARDAGIQEFYHIKVMLKYIIFMESWMPVSRTGMTRKGHWDDRKETLG